MVGLGKPFDARVGVWTFSMPYCSKCGRHMADSDNFCSRCGHRLGRAAMNDDVPKGSDDECLRCKGSGSCKAKNNASDVQYFINSVLTLGIGVLAYEKYEKCQLCDGTGKR